MYVLDRQLGGYQPKTVHLQLLSIQTFKHFQRTLTSLSYFNAIQNNVFLIYHNMDV